MKTIALFLVLAYAIPGQASAGPDCSDLTFADDTTIAAYDVPPKIVKQAPVEYPQSAKDDSLEGDVILMMTVSEDGTVFSVKVKKGVREDLDQAAVESANSWSFTPAKKDGKSVRSVVAVPVRFKLDGKTVKKAKPLKVGKKVEGATPRVAKKVPPAYPDEALKEKIEGTVHIEMIVNAEGKVVKAKVLKSAHPALDEAALDAVRKWTFEPSDQKSSSVVVPVKFRLSPKEK